MSRLKIVLLILAAVSVIAIGVTIIVTDSHKPELSESDKAFLGGEVHNSPAKEF